MKAKEFRMFPINRICPKCGSGNWMRGMEGPNVGELDIKCLNCLSYFKSAELYSDITTFNPRLISRGTACAYLRVDDYNPHHDFIDDCIENGTRISFEEAKITPEEWAEVKNDFMINDVMRVACLYAMGWLYEHKDEDNQYDLRLTLRAILNSIRERKLWKVSE